MFIYVLFLDVKKLIRNTAVFFNFSVNVNFLQIPFKRYLCLLVFGTNVAKQL